MLAIGRTPLTYIHRYIQHLAFNTAHKLALSKWRSLEVQASHHTVA